MSASEVRALLEEAYEGVIDVHITEHGRHGEADDWTKVLVTMSDRSRHEGWVYRHNVYATIWEERPRMPESVSTREAEEAMEPALWQI